LFQALKEGMLGYTYIGGAPDVEVASPVEKRHEVGRGGGETQSPLLKISR